MTTKSEMKYALPILLLACSTPAHPHPAASDAGDLRLPTLRAANHPTTLAHLAPDLDAGSDPDASQPTRAVFVVRDSGTDAGHDAGSFDAGHDSGTPDSGTDAGRPDAGHHVVVCVTTMGPYGLVTICK